MLSGCDGSKDEVPKARLDRLLKKECEWEYCTSPSRFRSLDASGDGSGAAALAAAAVAAAAAVSAGGIDPGPPPQKIIPSDRTSRYAERSLT